MKEKKSLLDRWSEWLGLRGKSRPSNEFSYGKGMDKVTMRLPKSVEEQFKLVNMMEVLDQFPNDYKLKLDFFNAIAQYGTTLDQPVNMTLLGYDGTETYISLYCDLLLRPLSQGAATKLQETIMEILPNTTQSTK
jgi:hypothetical protein